jgi:short-subunit dehydrogenase
MPGWFASEVAIITGASSGIGWELAKVLAREGAKVGLIARRQDKLEELAEEIRQAGGTAESAAADVGQREEIIEAIERLTATLGPVDLMIANAGVGTTTLLERPNTADVEAMFRVNVFGMVYAIEAVLPEMLRRKKGHLAAVSSLASYRGLPGQAGYCASKAAINTYLEALRLQLRGRGVAVTTICPGFIRTPMTAEHQFHMPWLMEPDYAARRIAKALYQKRKVLNFPLPTALLIRLSRFAPDWLMKRIVGGYEDKGVQSPIVQAKSCK